MDLRAVAGGAPPRALRAAAGEGEPAGHQQDVHPAAGRHACLWDVLALLPFPELRAIALCSRSARSAVRGAVAGRPGLPFALRFAVRGTVRARECRTCGRATRLSVRRRARGPLALCSRCQRRDLVPVSFDTWLRMRRTHPYTCDPGQRGGRVLIGPRRGGAQASRSSARAARRPPGTS